jgi:hypothetical protein
VPGHTLAASHSTESATPITLSTILGFRSSAAAPVEYALACSGARPHPSRLTTQLNRLHLITLPNLLAFKSCAAAPVEYALACSGARPHPFAAGHSTESATLINLSTILGFKIRRSLKVGEGGPRISPR